MDNPSVDNPSGKLNIIDGQLWYSDGSNIAVYSTNLEKLRTIKLSDISRIRDLAEMKDDLVAVASNNGLFLIDKQGMFIELI